jgi:hypothetical protein
MLTAEEKNRQFLTGNPFIDPHFQHEGTEVIRWITGGSSPSTHVTLEQEGSEIIARCPSCKKEMGRFDANYGPSTAKQLIKIRRAGNDHSKGEHLI